MRRGLALLLLAVSAQAADLDPHFLELPAHDLEVVGGSDAARPLQVGDTLRIKVVGLDPPAARVEVPPGVDALANQGFRVEVKDGGLAVTALKEGALTLPSLAMFASAEPDAKPVARTNPLPFQIKSAISPDDPKPEEPVDLRPPVDLPFPWPAAVAAFLALAALIGAAVGLWKKYGRKRAAPAAAPAAPARPARPEDEEALIALAELERAGPLKKGGFKAHYFRISEILKTYCGRRWDFDAMESTTAELMARIEQSPGALAETQKQRLRSIFDRLDRVKFTDFKPLPDEASALVGEARDFVMLSKRPRPAVDPAGRPSP